MDESTSAPGKAQPTARKPVTPQIPPASPTRCVGETDAAFVARLPNGPQITMATPDDDDDDLTDHAPRLRRVLRRYALPGYGVDDLLQDVYVSVLVSRARSTVGPPRHLGRWLTTVAQHVGSRRRDRELARRGEVVGESDEALDPIDPKAFDPAEVAEVRQRYRTAWRALTLADRRLIRTGTEGLDKATRQRIYRARRKLRAV